MALGRVVTLDAMGTLLALETPVPRLVVGLRTHGVAVSEAEAASALRAEIAFYRAHHDEGRDTAGLAALRERCTEVLRSALPAGARDLPRDDLRAVLLGALRFRAYPEVPGVLAALRAAGHRLVVVSNWDVSLHEVLEQTGLAALVDAAISSAEAGAAKPDPAIFARALALAGADARGGLHAGDSIAHDVAGARAAGLRPVLVDRAGGADRRAPDGVARIATLDGLPALAA